MFECQHVTVAMNRPRAILILTVVATCFTLGLLSVLLRDRRKAYIPMDPSKQKTILVIGVERLEPPKPSLRALWIVTFRPPGKDLFLLGIPITDALSASFAWSPESGVNPAFLQIVGAETPLEPEMIVVVDEVGFAALVDYMGGVEINGSHLDGQAVITFLALLNEDREAALRLQRRVLEALSERVSSIGTTPDLTPLIDLIPNHGYLSAPLVRYVTLLSSLLPLGSESIHVHLLTDAGGSKENGNDN